MEAQSKKRYARFAWLVLLFLAIAGGVIWLRPILMPFFFALLLTYLLRAPLNSMRRLGVKSGVAIIILYAYLFLAVYALILLCLPVFTQQLGRLINNLPDLLEQLSLAWQRISSSWGGIVPQSISDAISQAGAGITDRLADALAAQAGKLGRLVSILFYLVLAPILAFYMLRDKGSAKQQIMLAITPERRTELRRLAGELDGILRGFINGYLLVSVVVAIISAVFFWAIGVEYAMVLGLIMGIADLIPYFGPLLGAIPAVLIAWGQSSALALITAVGIIILQQAEGAIITPKIMGDKVGLHPLATIFVVMAGGYVAGLLGTILAVPVAAAGILLVKYSYAALVGAAPTQ